VAPARRGRAFFQQSAIRKGKGSKWVVPALRKKGVSYIPGPTARKK
jgi:hypothetical protein